MVIILEGPNRCGKTTYAEMLQKAGFIYFKSNKILTPKDSVQRMTGIIDTLKAMNEQGINCVVDRFHITDRVYGKVVRGEEVDIRQIDKMCNEAGFTLIYMINSVENIIKRGASHKTPADIIELTKEYEKEFEASIMTKYRMEWCEV